MELLAAHRLVEHVALPLQESDRNRRSRDAAPERAHEEPGAHHRGEPMGLERHDPVVREHAHHDCVYDHECRGETCHTPVGNDLLDLLTKPSPRETLPVELPAAVGIGVSLGQAHIGPKRQVREVERHPEKNKHSDHVPRQKERRVEVGRFLREDRIENWILGHLSDPGKIRLAEQEHRHEHHERDRKEGHERQTHATDRPIPLRLRDPCHHGKQYRSHGDVREEQPVRDVRLPSPVGLDRPEEEETCEANPEHPKEYHVPFLGTGEIPNGNLGGDVNMTHRTTVPPRPPAYYRPRAATGAHNSRCASGRSC